MSITTYRIIGSTLVIPGVPGEWHAGQEVDVDNDTNTVIANRLLPIVAPTSESLPPEIVEQSAQPFDKPSEHPTVAVEQATEEIEEGNI